MPLDSGPTEFVKAPPPRDTLSSKADKVLHGAALTFGMGMLPGILVGLATCAWLAWQAPLLESELAQASWLSSPTVALHFSEGPMAYALAAGLMLTGIAAGIAKNSLALALATGFLVTSVHIGAGKEAVVRVGILEDAIKVGCYVPELKECHEMLGVPVETLRSRYDEHQRSSWYVSEQAKVVAQDQEQMALSYSLPGMALIRAPWHLGHAQQLKDKLSSQRAGVLALQQKLRAR